MKPQISVALACLVLAGSLSLRAIAADIDPQPIEGSEVEGLAAPREIVIERGRVRVEVIASGGAIVSLPPDATDWSGPFVGQDLAPWERSSKMCADDMGFRPRSSRLDLDDFAGRLRPRECPAAGANARGKEITIRIARRAEDRTGQATERPEAAGATTDPDAPPAVPPPAPLGPK